MCTVSILPTGHAERAIRVIFSRDELDTRAHAHPPAVRFFGPRRAILPIDPLSGGTWIAANDSGIACCVLNVNERDSAAFLRTSEMRSRGTIIPELIRCSSLDEATERALQLPCREFQPFRLLIIQQRLVSEIVSHGSAARCARAGLGAPLMRCSSGLGDAIVQAPRQALFDGMLGQSASIQSQDEFHRHFWKDRRDISVCMARAGARTVSRTTLEVSERGVARMHYEPIDEHAVTT